MLSYQIYPLETQDIFLNRAVRPFLEQHVWPVKNARAFFIRYEDEDGPHIRLRLRGDGVFLKNELQPAVNQHFAERGKVIEKIYQPETERFGGERNMALAEEYFHQSTRVVLERLNRETFTYGDSMFDALRLHAISAFAAGFDRKTTAWYFGQLCDQWMPLFFRHENEKTPGKEFEQQLKRDFTFNLEPQKVAIKDALNRFWKDLENGKVDKSQPEWLRWLRANELILKEFGNDLQKVFPSLLHLTNNRLGITNQDEVYLNFILSSVLK